MGGLLGISTQSFPIRTDRGNGPPTVAASWIEVEEPQETENGRFTWAEDPEGNRFELYQPPASA